MNDLSHTCIDLRIGHICQYYKSVVGADIITTYCTKYGKLMQKGQQLRSSWIPYHLASGGGCPSKDDPDSIVELNL